MSTKTADEAAVIMNSVDNKIEATANRSNNNKKKEKDKSSEGTSKKSNILNINIGILGHVDSGKTSLVKALSTSLSTAALDKNPQSQARGITIDLGFSAFQLEVPKHIQDEVGADTYKAMQFTLVDCPGHASLIRTIIGGAQIIDMMILVVDANKGIQTQTAECIIIGEMTTDKLIIVLNKIDMILPVEERSVKLARVVARIRRTFATTKFHDAPIIATAAAVGGEKVASVGAYLNNNSNTSAVPHALDNIGVDSLVNLIKSSVTVPRRRVDMPFYYSIDHCFAIKGHGTVLTGTVLSGSINSGGVIEFPELQLQRKVKSMQMFHKTCKYAQQGDRIGMCVTNLDPTAIERGIAAAPSSVPLLSTVVCLVKKIRFFRQACKSESKFHITVGHTTVIAKATFFGAEEIKNRKRTQASILSADSGNGELGEIKTVESCEKKNKHGSNTVVGSEVGQSTLSASSYAHNFPSDIVSYDFDQEFEYQSELVGGEGDDKHYYGREPVQWVLLELQTPVYCPLGSLIIGSRLDIENKGSKKSSNIASKRSANANTSLDNAGEDKMDDVDGSGNVNDTTSEGEGAASTHDQLAKAVAGINSTAIANAPAASDIPTLPMADVLSKALGNVGVTGSAANAALVSNAANAAGSQIVKQCRLAFYGPIKGYLSHNNGNTSTTSLSNNVSHSAISPLFSLQDPAIAHSTSNSNPELIRIFNWKEKHGAVLLIADEQVTNSESTCSELVGWKLFSKGGNLSPFLNMLVEIEIKTTDKKSDLKSKSCSGSGHDGLDKGNKGTNVVYGVIYSILGTSGKFKVRLICPWDFSGNTDATSKIPVNTSVPYRTTGVVIGAKITLKFKRYIYDTSKSMKQDVCYLKPPPAGISPPKAEKEKSQNKIGVVSTGVGGCEKVSLSLENKDFEQSGNANSADASKKPVTNAVKMVSISQNTMFKVQVPSSGRAASTGKLMDARRIIESSVNSASSSTPISSARKRMDQVAILKKSVVKPEDSSKSTIERNKDSNLSSPLHKASRAPISAAPSVNPWNKLSNLKLGESAITSSAGAQANTSGSSASMSTNTHNPTSELHKMRYADVSRMQGAPNSVAKSRNVISKSAPKPRPGVWGRPVSSPNHTQTQTSSTKWIKDGASDGRSNSSSNNGVSKGLRFAAAVEERQPYPNVPASHSKASTNTVSGATSRFPPGSIVRSGVIDSIKSSQGPAGSPPTAGDVIYDTVIVSQAFSMEENIKQYIGCPVRGPNGQSGEVVGPYAKMGKCKVKFPTGLSPMKHLRETVEILLDC